VLFITESVGHTLNFGFICLVILFIGGAFGRVLWGFISDHFFNHNRGNILGTLGLISGSLVIALCFLTIYTHPMVILIMAFLLGISTQGWNGIYVLMLSEIVKPHYIGLASGFGLTFGYLGAIIGTPLSGWIVDLSGGFKVMWLIVGVCILNISILTYFVKFDKFLIKE
jgi:ACS family hexuronate transporter-like MFS transporter